VVLLPFGAIDIVPPVDSNNQNVVPRVKLGFFLKQSLEKIADLLSSKAAWQQTCQKAQQV
jgi:hypothetical protein